MENASKAIFMAFAVMIFVIAITMTFVSMSRAKETADAIVQMTDKTNFHSYYDGDQKLVTKDRVIATLYNYHKEHYRVEIEKDTTKIIFDLDEEISTPWVGKESNLLKSIDLFISGVGPDEKINGSPVTIDSAVERGKVVDGKYNIAQATLNSLLTSTTSKITESFNVDIIAADKFEDVATGEEIISDLNEDEIKKVTIYYKIED